MFCAEGLKFGPATQKTLSPISDHFRRAAAADRFTGKSGSTLEIIAPAGLNVPRLVVVGIGKERDLKDRDLVRLGGVAMGKIPALLRRRRSWPSLRLGRAEGRPDRRSGRSALVCVRTGSIAIRPSARKATSGRPRSRSISPAPIPPRRKRLGPPPRKVSPTASVWARDLVNEPANVLYPGEFARRASASLRKARHRRRGSRRGGHEEARHGCAPRRRPGLGA